jgi:hypothetical protein
MSVVSDSRGADAARARISVWQIEPDNARPGRIVTRDEAGAIAFVSHDGGRSWSRVAGDEVSSVVAGVSR